NRMKNEDRILVSGILNGDESALRAFYIAHASRIAGFIRQRIGLEKDVEELTQDTFMAALEALRDFSFRCTVSTFLCSIAKRKIVDHYRREKIKRIVFSQIPQIESILMLLTTPEDKLDQALLVEKIEETFNRLAPRYRQILKLRYVEGFTVHEIAQELSMSFKSVESMLFRARRAFATEFRGG
ncbi:MAG TPA: RNA polymerase sigma factor, partial [Patescibacteria group bacterium]|nr:RNA polymerase sigma factor [Patescibacteria group bacterium]